MELADCDAAIGVCVFRRAIDGRNLERRDEWATGSGVDPRRRSGWKPRRRRSVSPFNSAGRMEFGGQERRLWPRCSPRNWTARFSASRPCIRCGTEARNSARTSGFASRCFLKTRACSPAGSRLKASLLVTLAYACGNRSNCRLLEQIQHGAQFGLHFVPFLSRCGFFGRK